MDTVLIFWCLELWVVVVLGGEGGDKERWEEDGGERVKMNLFYFYVKKTKN